MSSRRRWGNSTTPSPAAVGGQDDSKRMRSEALPSGGAEKGSSSSSPPAMVVRDLMVDEHVLDCRVCFLPLKPPIFQCGVGHVLCSPCSDKLKDAGKCHVCGVAMPAGGYRRCHAMEDVMNSIRGPCPHAAHGCDATTVYHAREEHIQQCPHAPCHCPGDACGFVGSVTTLIEHLAAAHSWSCTAEHSPGYMFSVELRDGFNFLNAVRGSAKYLFLLNVASTPFGRAISAVRIGSVATMVSSSSAPATRNTIWNLEILFSKYKGSKLVHEQSSNFQLECTCPSNGLSDPNASFQFFLPKSVGYGNATDIIWAKLFISSS